MIHVVGRSSLVVGKTRTISGTAPPMIMKANGQGRTTNDALPIPCSSPQFSVQLLMCKSTVTLSLHSVPQGRYHHLVPNGHAPWLAFCAH